MDTSVSLLILAAGLGSRFGLAKQILQIPPLGLPLFAFSLQNAVKNGVTHAVIVTRSELANFFEANIFPRFLAIHFDIIFQDLVGPKLPRNRTKPWGTGHAVLCARDYIRGNFVVVNADDFYGAEAIGAAVNFVKKNNTECCCIGYPLIQTLSASGPVSRGIIEVDSENRATAITEVTQIQRLADGSIISLNSAKNFDSALLWPQRLVSLNLFGLSRDIFTILEQKFYSFLQKNQNSPTAEFYLPGAIVGANIFGRKLAMKMVPTQDYWFGVTYRGDIALVEERLRELVAKGLYT
ncbi:MAG: NTP transferase domain-containing protein [Puniceicoccales bacterium]|jgi:UTP-glucose-1-phosphate uridylyltransferase|nr:NTP transferase domain-containing protein [Puniceicoccales bacterium]